MAPKFVSFSQALFFLIEWVIYKCIYNALISDWPSNDQKRDSKDNMELYNSVMKTIVKKF